MLAEVTPLWDTVAVVWPFDTFETPLLLNLALPSTSSAVPFGLVQCIALPFSLVANMASPLLDWPNTPWPPLPDVMSMPATPLLPGVAVWPTTPVLWSEMPRTPMPIVDRP